MSCPDFEDLVRQGPGGHASHCERCAALLEALAEVDTGLEAAYSGITAPPSLAAAVRMRIAAESPGRRLSLLPEVLDFIGWAAILALAAALVPPFLRYVSAALSAISSAAGPSGPRF